MTFITTNRTKMKIQTSILRLGAWAPLLAFAVLPARAQTFGTTSAVSYTFQVAGVSDVTGDALAEVYEVP